MPRPVFKTYQQGQVSLFPASLEEKIAQDSPARMINQIVDNLDISKVLSTYKGGGTSSYHPRMMLKVVLYSYLNNIYSSRKIEQAISDRVSFMWLSGNQVPDHNTINRFRSSNLKDAIHEIFTQVVSMLVDMGCLSLEVMYLDGTKVESRANRYTFVWRKTTEKNKAKLEEKIRRILEMVEEGIAQDNQPDDEPPRPINSEELKKRIEQINEQNRSKEAQKAIKTLKNKHLPKLQEYEEKLETMGSRNSYSKTDPGATFMRMKEDHMQNGQLKPAYNLQIGTENQFLTHYDLFPNPNDTLTMIPFMLGFGERFASLPEKLVADSGYGSEENYEFMESNGIEPFVKYNYFHQEQTKSFKENGFLAQNLHYNPEGDYMVCPMGQHMKNVGTRTRKPENGYVSQSSIYQASSCQDCPLRGPCHKGESNRIIELNHNLNRHKKRARELLKSPEGIHHRGRRPVEPESVFGQIKSNKAYNRFRHFDKERILVDFAILAIAFNLGKMHQKSKGKGKYEGKNQGKHANGFLVVVVIRFLMKTVGQPELDKEHLKAAA